MQRAAVALLVVTVALGGCVGSGGGQGAPAGNASESSPGDDSSGTPTSADGGPMTFAANETVEETIWANDSFAPQETCNVVGCTTGAAFQTTEITDAVPAEVPATVHVTLTWEEDTAPLWNEVSAWIGGEETAFYDYRWANPEPGRVEVDVTVVRSRDGSLTVNAFGNRPQASADPSVPYSLRVDVAADPTRVPAGVPVAAPLQPGDTVTAEPLGGETARIRVYGPNDTHLADISGAAASFSVPEDGAAGSYVLVPSEIGANVTFHVDDGPATMAPLGLSYDVGPYRTYNGTGEESWSFDVDGTPLRVGVSVRDVWSTRSPTGDGPWVSTEPMTATITMPGGDSESGTMLCGVCFSLVGSYFDGMGTPLGDQRLASGTYEVTVSSQAAAPFEYAEVVLTYVR